MKTTITSTFFTFLFLLIAFTMKAQWIDLNAPSLQSPDYYNYAKLAVSGNGKNIALWGSKIINFSGTFYYVTSNNYGVTWNEYPAPQQVPINMFWDGDDLYVQGHGSDSTLKKSSDFGASFTIQNSSFFPASIAVPILRASSNSWFAVKNVSPLQFNIFQSTDKGINWTNQGPVSAAAIPNFFDYAFAANGSIVSTSVNGAAYSTDNGFTWTAGSFPNSIAPALDNVVSKAANGEMIFLDNLFKYLYKSSDNGVSWTQLLSNFPANILRCAYYNNDILCICTDGSVYISSNGGSSFSQLNAAGSLWENTAFAIYCLEETASNLFASGRNKVYRYGPLSSVTDNISGSSMFLNVFPNPSAGEFKIVSNLKGNFSLYDATGRLLEHFEISSPKAVDQSYILPKGIYLLRHAETGVMKKIQIH